MKLFSRSIDYIVAVYILRFYCYFVGAEISVAFEVSVELDVVSISMRPEPSLSLVSVKSFPRVSRFSLSNSGDSISNRVSCRLPALLA